MREAVGHGAHAIEADVHMYRGRLEVRHARTVGPLPILVDRWEVRWRRQQRPTLGDLLDNMPAGYVLIVDLKGRSHRLARAVREAVTSRIAQGEHVMVCARHWPLLDHFTNMGGVTPIYSVGRASQLRRLLREHRTDEQFAISIHQRLLAAPVIEELLGRAHLVMSWPINCPHRAAELIDAGVHGLISDEPSRIAPILHRVHERSIA